MPNNGLFSPHENHLKITFTLCFGLLLTLTHCNKTDNLTIAGSTTVLPVISKAAEQFKALRGINIIVNVGGSGVGINQLGEGRIDIGMISRDITSEETKRYPKVQFTTHAIGIDAVIPVVSSEVYAAGIRALTLQQIGNIYVGNITNWQQVGGPNIDILVVDKEKSRGTRHVFIEKILGDKEAVAPGADLVLGANNEEQTAITQSDSAIGMLSIAWLNEEVKGLSIIMQNGKAIEPTLNNVGNGSFPILRQLLLVTNGKPQGKIKTFIDFVLSSEGQKIVKETGYISVR